MAAQRVQTALQQSVRDKVVEPTYHYSKAQSGCDQSALHYCRLLFCHVILLVLFAIRSMNAWLGGALAPRGRLKPPLQIFAIALHSSYQVFNSPSQCPSFS